MGIENVRIVDTRDLEPIFHATNFQLTLKNLLICDARQKNSFTIAVTSGKLFLVDVRIYSTCTYTEFSIHGPAYPVLRATNQSEVEVFRSTFVDCRSGFSIEQSEAKFIECRWKNIETFNVRIDSKLTMVQSSMIGVTKGGSIQGSVEASFRGCEFVAKSGYAMKIVHGRSVLGNTDSKSVPTHFVLAERGAQLRLESCSLSGFHFPIRVHDFHSKADIRKCKLLDCRYGLSSDMNSSISVVDCRLAVNAVILLARNVRGNIEFRRNFVQIGRFFDREKYPRGVKAVFVSDSEPGVIKHDFESHAYQPHESRKPENDGIGGTAKMQSKYMSGIMAAAAADPLADAAEDPFQHRAPWSMDSFKSCRYCESTRYEKPEAKFMYCSACKKVCYCSKECQSAHWKDHKLVCDRRSKKSQ